MQDLYLIAFDGSDASLRALTFGTGRARASDASVLLAHVLEWSPYSFLTAEELEERHKRRTAEVTRAEEIILEPVRKRLSDDGLTVTTAIRYGHVAETLAEIAREAEATQIFIGRTGESKMAARLFGSVAGTLAQVAPVPCTIVP